MGRIGHNS
jgi:hypothetical protein